MLRPAVPLSGLGLPPNHRITTPSSLVPLPRPRVQNCRRSVAHGISAAPYHAGQLVRSCTAVIQPSNFPLLYLTSQSRHRAFDQRFCRVWGHYHRNVAHETAMIVLPTQSCLQGQRTRCFAVVPSRSAQSGHSPVAPLLLLMWGCRRTFAPSSTEPKPTSCHHDVVRGAAAAVASRRCRVRGHQHS